MKAGIHRKSRRNLRSIPAVRWRHHPRWCRQWNSGWSQRTRSVRSVLEQLQNVVVVTTVIIAQLEGNLADDLEPRELPDVELFDVPGPRGAEAARLGGALFVLLQ